MTFCIKNLLAAIPVVVLATMSVSAQSVSSLGNLPLYFEAQGQGGARQYLAHSRDGQVLISPAGAEIALRSEAVVCAQFLGANPAAQIQGEAELAGRINYLTGSNPAKWRTGIPTFAKVRIANLYPGVDAVYYGNQRQLEYDLNLAPGVSPEAIAIRFDGVNKISVDAQGNLVLIAGGSEIDQAKPLIYQTVAGVRQKIEGGYKIVDAQTVAFSVGNYDHRQPLVIDPILSYSSYFGGAPGSAAWAMKINTNNGDIFVAGNMLCATNWTTGAYQTNFKGGSFLGDAFVAKFDHGFNPIYLTYLGGSADDVALAIAVDPAENVFVGGFTDSPDFPVVTNTNTTPAVKGVPGITNHIGGSIFQPTGYYPLDGFVAELAAGGSNLVYSTYLGGNNDDAVYALAIDSSDNVYVTGFTGSTNMPVKNPIAYRMLANGVTNYFLNTLVCSNTYANCNAFIAKISNLGTNLDYLTYFGGSTLDFGHGIAVDSDDNVYVAGFTSSTNFPTTNAFQVNLNQSSNIIFNLDAFVAKLAPSPTNLHLLYSTFLGDTNNDAAYGLAIDSQGAAYVAGYTTSPYFPDNRTNVIFRGVTNNIYGSLATNVFLTKIITYSTTNASQVVNPNNSAISYSVVFGGFLMDVGNAVAVDPKGDAFVTGASESKVFPGTNALGYLRATNSGANDAFVTAFDPGCSNLLYSVLLGGPGNDSGNAIAVDSSSSAYVVGQTASLVFPVTTAETNLPMVLTAHQTTLSGSNDCFVAKILINQVQPPFSISVGTTNLITETKSNSVTIYHTNSIVDRVKLAWQNYTNADLIGYYALQATTNLAAPNWQAVTPLPTLVNNTNFVTLPNTNQHQFFRLYP